MKSSPPSNWQHSILPFALLAPLLTCCVVSPFELYSARIAVTLGFGFLITGAIMTYLQMKKMGAATNENVPWYLNGGAAMMIFQINAAIRYPSMIAGWVVLEILGGFVLIGSGIMIESRNPPRVYELFGDKGAQAKADPQKNNPGPPPFKPKDDDNPLKKGDDPFKKKDDDPFKKKDDDFPFKKPKDEKPPPAGVTGDPALDQLLADMESMNPFVAEKAANALALMQPNQHRAAVAQKLAERMIQAGDFKRTPYIKALGTWGTAAEVPALIQILENPSPFGRDVVIKTLGQLRDERAIAPLARLLKDGSHEVASEALRAFGPAAEGAVLAYMNAQSPFVRVSVAKLLKEIGTQKSVPVLQQYAGEAVFNIGALCRDAIATINARTKK